MKNLKRLGLSVTLLCILAMAAFAGETNSPPCTPPDPGETNSPPCASAQITPADSVASGNPIPVASTARGDYSVGDAAVDLLQSALLLF